MLRLVALILLLVFSAGLAFGSTREATVNFWTEFDIVFWQTAPFATFWGYLAFFPGTLNWNGVLTLATAVSAGNAFRHARQVTAKR
jgi:hypothetical protein